MSVASKLKLLSKLKRKKYRDAYVEEHVRTSLPFQIRALREQRDWTQGRLAEELKTTQTAVSRLENPEYGKLSLNSLYKLASAFDVALLVKFVPFSRLVEEFKDASPQALSAASFEAEFEVLEKWAAEDKADSELAPAVEGGIVLNAEHLFPGLPATATQVHFLPGMLPAGVATISEKQETASTEISPAEEPNYRTTKSRVAVAGGRNDR